MERMEWGKAGLGDHENRKWARRRKGSEDKPRGDLGAQWAVVPMDCPGDRYIGGSAPWGWSLQRER